MNNGLFYTEIGLFVGGVSTMPVSEIASTVCLCVSAVIGIINLISTIKNALIDKKISKEEEKQIIEQTKATAQQIENCIDNIKENCNNDKSN